MSITTIHEIPRDRYKRPLVTPPGGGKPVAYTRCTTFVSVLEDTFNLSKWQQRMVALGLAERPDLMLQIASTSKDDKKALDGVCEAAMEAAKAHAAATVGTALHALTERIDRGEDLGVIPDAYKADLQAYQSATSDLTAVHIETFSVNDDYRVGGTPDRVVEHNGRLRIADIKTGSVQWGMGKIAMQLAMYAHSAPYDYRTGQRSTWGDIDLTTGIVIHLPAGTGTCELLEVDLTAGWEAVHLAAEVRAWRARKDLSKPITIATPTLFPEQVAMDLELVAEQIATAKSVTELEHIWAAHAHAWTDDLTTLSVARKTLLTEGVVTTTTTGATA